MNTSFSATGIEYKVFFFILTYLSNPFYKATKRQVTSQSSLHCTEEINAVESATVRLMAKISYRRPRGSERENDCALWQRIKEKRGGNGVKESPD